jgi:hypothetical protein
MSEKLQGTGARLTEKQVRRLEQVAAVVPVPPGAKAYTRADALRAAVDEGLVVLEKRYKLKRAT